MRSRVVLPVLATILASCGSGSSSGSDGPDLYVPPDPLPVIQSTTPSNYSVGVATTLVISARFSEPMQASSITSSSFHLSTSTGFVAGTVSASPDLFEVRFTPAAPLPLEKAYTVTVTSAIRSLSGQSMASPYSWKFATGFDWEWSVPELVENLAGNGASSTSGPEVALDPLGNAAAVWRQWDETGTVLRLYAARAPAGDAWESPILLNSGFGTNSPFIDFGAPGQVVAVWADDTQIWASRASMTGAWSSPESAVAAPFWDVVIEAMFADSAGNIVVFYQENLDGPQYDNLYVLRYDPQAGWLPRESLPCHDSDRPSFASDDSGIVVALWTPFGNKYSVLARRFTPGSGWSANETVSAYDITRPVGVPFVTLDGTGNILALWWRRIAGGQANERQFYISRRGTGSTWSTPEPVPTGGEVHVNFPLAALAPDGSALITWIFSSYQCWGVHQDADGDWGTPEQIDTDWPDSVPETGIPFYSGFGRFAVMGVRNVYNEAIASFTHSFLWVTEHNPATGFGSPWTFYTAAQPIYNFSLTRDVSGRGAAIWQDSAPRNIAASRFR